MNKSLESRSRRMTPLASRAIQAALFFLPLELFLLGFLIYQITLNPATHLYIIGAISVVALLSNIVGIITILRNRPEAGIWISGIGCLVLLSSSSFLFSGLGFHVFLFTVLTSVLLVSRTLQGRQASTFLALGFLSGIISLLVDQFFPVERRVLLFLAGWIVRCRLPGAHGHYYGHPAVPRFFHSHKNAHCIHERCPNLHRCCWCHRRHSNR